jgi:SprT-like family
MARQNPIQHIMGQSLPSKTYQRRKSFRPGPPDVVYAYNILNRYLFDNRLRQPTIRTGVIQQAWGWCHWFTEAQDTGSFCEIKISDKWFCQQWMMNILAHEMVHQYQWDIYRWEKKNGRMSMKGAGHGPSFFMWRERFQHYGLTLKTYYRSQKWFETQDFKKS